MNKIAYSVIILLIVISCNNTTTPPISDRQTDKEARDSLSFADSLAKSETEQIKLMDSLFADKWVYDERENPETGKKDKLAFMSSSEKLFFKSPYDGGSTLSLHIRKMDNTTEVYLNVVKGQFQIQNQTAILKFDNEKPLTVNLTSSSENGSDMVFLDNEQTIIKKLKTSKKLVVEAPFYKEGRRKVAFKVGGFIWE